MTDEEAIYRAIVHLRLARDLLVRAKAKRAAARVRLALTSAGGAARHAINRAIKAGRTPSRWNARIG